MIATGMNEKCLSYCDGLLPVEDSIRVDCSWLCQLISKNAFALTATLSPFILHAQQLIIQSLKCRRTTTMTKQIHTHINDINPHLFAYL